MTEPTRRERIRPAELLGIAGVFAVFTGVIVLLSTREPKLSLIFLLIAFIVAAVILAMLTLAAKPNDVEQHEIDEEDRPRGH
ncbi:hypothetical protein [Frondihabitans cladoniiphilus]|uniref:Uncharacterized protein n=1 Tax=Frondihabitans cladoniiphilus TaxID=715785 RepID=A0ABP8WBI9_9MICO